VNCQTERNAEIKFEKDTRKIKINSFSLFMEVIQSFIRVKPTVLGTAFHHEPGFKAENLIKYRILCRHYNEACGGGATTETCATLFWATLNLLITENSLTFNHKTNDVNVSKIDHKF